MKGGERKPKKTVFQSKSHGLKVQRGCSSKEAELGSLPVMKDNLGRDSPRMSFLVNEESEL